MAASLMFSPQSNLWTCWLLLAAIGAMFLPGDIQASFRTAMGDLVRPGCQVWEQGRGQITEICARWRGGDSHATPEVETLRNELNQAQVRMRELEIQLAQMRELAAAERPPLFAESSSAQAKRLAGPVLISAAVLGDASAPAWRTGRWLDQGKSAGVVEEAPLLAANQRLLDLGRDARISSEDSLLLGRSVIGKVQQAGRWTSSFLLVTDAGYRGRAQVVRQTSEGYVFGGKGVLKGQGEACCRLEGVSAAETVEIGDSVYTAERDGILPTPLYYGKVIEATLEDRSREWKILVEPVERPADLTTVHVLRTALNPLRSLTN